MVAIGRCSSCRGKNPAHCYGSGDRKTLPGMLGGFRCICPCREQADQPKEKK